jgi:hypothetical protein
MSQADTGKQWVFDEVHRNVTNAALFATLACASYGQEFEFFIGHHLAYKRTHKDITTKSEIPSADTLLFDHDIMIDVFGPRALDVMAQLARTPTAKREAVLEQMLRDHKSGNLLDMLCKYTVDMSQGVIA